VRKGTHLLGGDDEDIETATTNRVWKIIHPQLGASTHLPDPIAHRAWVLQSCILSSICSAHLEHSGDPFRARIGSVSHGLLAFMSNPNFLLKVMHRVRFVPFHGCIDFILIFNFFGWSRTYNRAVFERCWI